MNMFTITKDQMRMLRTILLLLPLAIHVGCGTPKVWYQEGMTFQETQRQLAACRAEAARLENPLAMVNLGFALANSANKKDFVRNCMIANGYSLVEQNALPTGVTGVPE
jgi:hypothetical protein